MKIFKNISSFIGYQAYKNSSGFTLFFLFFVVISFSASFASIKFLSVTFFCIFFIAGSIFMFSFLIGLKNTGSKNYKVAILRATQIRSELNKPRSWMNVEIFSKISDLITETKQTKDPTKLNEFIKKVQKCDQMKKFQKEKRELLINLPDDINKLDTEVYLLEDSLLP